MNQCWCAQSLVLKGNMGRVLISGGYGTMGCALPFAIGASISKNRDKSGVKTPLKVESIKLGREDTELGRDDAR